MDIYDKINELYDKRREIELGGGDDKIEKQKDKGKMTARERIDYLLDDGSFVELNAFMEHRVTDFGMAGKKLREKVLSPVLVKSMEDPYTYSLKISRFMVELLVKCTVKRSPQSWT